MHSIQRPVQPTTLWMLALAGMLMAGCADKQKPEAKAANQSSQSNPVETKYPQLPTEAPSSPTASAVRISDEIVRACGISDADAYFAFDSAKLRGDDVRVLDKVAECFIKGPLQGRGMKLVGRADPRGTQDYNMTLGQSRADSVGKYLESKGVPAPRVETTTRGALDAVGIDEPTWTKDRRVDVLLSSR